MLKKALITSVLAMSIAMTGCSDQKAEQKAPSWVLFVLALGECGKSGGLHHRKLALVTPHY